jgi:anti-anti-sigma factor
MKSTFSGQNAKTPNSPPQKRNGHVLVTHDDVASASTEIPIQIRDQDQDNRRRDRILVVDDNPDILQFCADALTDSGYRVDTAEDGSAGWNVLHANSSNYNLLITDNTMPKISGIELVRILRNAHMDIPVILASSEFPAEMSRNPALELAATLLKPYTIEELVRTVEKTLKTAVPTRNHSGVSEQVLTVRGYKELTAINADKFHREVHAMVNGHKILEVDLSETTFMDCAGLGSLIALKHLVRDRGGKMRLLSPTPPVLRLFNQMRSETGNVGEFEIHCCII